MAFIVLTTSFGLLDKKHWCFSSYYKGSPEFHSQALKINYPEIVLYNKMHTVHELIDSILFLFITEMLPVP